MTSPRKRYISSSVVLRLSVATTRRLPWSMVQSSDIGGTIRTPDAAVTLDRQLKQSEGGRPARFGGTGMDPPPLPSPQRTAVKNQSYYALVLTLLVLISVAV